MAAVPHPSDGLDESPVVEVRRSRKRRRTVAAYREDGKVVVLLPARFTRAEEQEWVTTMLARLERSEKRRRPSDAGLRRRAAELAERYLEGRAAPDTVRWVANQNSRWGSCTPSDRSIRLSTRLQGMPSWVIDYVLVHELAHLLETGHTPAFWSWVDRYPKAERAKGFLEGVAVASALGIEADPPDCSAEGAAQMVADDR
jgi:predicted metal-dependent hydrolase